MTANRHQFVRKRITLIASALLSAAMLVVSLPSPDIGWLGWGALVPLLLAIQGLRPGQAAALGQLTGIVASFGIYGWLFEVPSFDLRHAVLLALYVGAYPATWASATAWALQRNMPLLVCAPVLWLLIDYLRGHAGFLALPWGTLAQTQHHNLPLLQTASVVGEHGVTFLVALGNAALAALCLRQERRLAAAAILLLVTAHVWGVTQLFSPTAGRSIRVVAVQPNIQIGDRTTEAGREANLTRLEGLTRAAASSQPDLIVWPESAIPGDLADRALVDRLQRLSNETNMPLIVGAAEVEKFATGDRLLTIGRRAFNTAHLFRPDQPPAPPYRKRMLVPFAEYLPHPDIIPWPEWLAPRVTELTPGDQAQLFTVSPGLSVGALICWENLFAPLARESVNDGATMLVQLTNDVWFGRSAAPRQHNLMSVMRAVENRTPMIVSSNTGPSQVIDGHGRIQAEMPHLFSTGAVTGHLQTGTGGTFYSAVGDAALLIVLLPLASWALWRWRAQACIHIVGHSDPVSERTGLEGIAQRQLR
ncbi:MAG: apolipoprotein N-acyltransferase [Nitrospira sp.]